MTFPYSSIIAENKARGLDIMNSDVRYFRYQEFLFSFTAYTGFGSDLSTTVLIFQLPYFTIMVLSSCFRIVLRIALDILLDEIL